MKKTDLAILALFAGVSLLLLSSCKIGCVKGSGNQASAARKVTDFTKLDISGAFKIILKQDSTLGVTVTTDDNLLQYVKTDIDGDRLVISTSKKSICSSGSIAITIGVRHLEAIKASGAVDLASDGKIVTKNVNLELSGATKINLDLDAADVTTTANGVTEITLKGQASSHSIEFDGGGKLHAFDFVAGSYNITSSGASECDINVLRELTVKSSGASAVKYKGNPATINNNKTGVSSITKVN
ncbi:head GIN domain-containing protein [Mucilaginibacter sp. UR6-11]|uniref:head GIN domain-containing protein n=1 Tax=Mucilaginibacter sp. UR6-11 TaxID=1435644 RepID=UPI001E55EAB1|nr:head GIN domain-containing protein [Mucilaginibacter sp. UR6-11]MCC8426660.1 DUF2807 domain-containing protein [Mucilaginibacter sp. UR6-11]